MPRSGRLGECRTKEEVMIGEGGGSRRTFMSGRARTVGQDHHLFLPLFAKHAIAFPVLIGI